MAMSASWVASCPSASLPGQAPADGVDLVVVAPQQLIEGTPVTGLCGPDEPGVRRGLCESSDPWLLLSFARHRGLVYVAGTW